MDDQLLSVWQRKGEVRIKSFDDFMENVDAFMKPREEPKLEVNRFLFRGTANVNWKLVPSLPRSVGPDLEKPDRPWLTRELLYHIETESTAQFRSKAHLYLDSKFIPEPNNYLAWWQLMQHHHAKTRMLDWTASPFVAAYFAVAESPTNDGAIWMVDHGAHYGRMAERYPDGTGRAKVMLYTGVQKIPIPGDPEPIIVVQILQESEKRTENLFDQRAKDDLDCLYFCPCVVRNQRMNAQSGWFSWAALIEADHGEAIARAFSHKPEHSDRWWCQRLVIDHDAKPEILRKLWHMNQTGETLYCGLDGLGRAMSELTDLLTPDHCKYQLEHGVLSVTKRH